MKSLLRYGTGPDDASAPPAVVPLEVSRREAFHGGKQISGASLNAIARHNETLRKRVTDIVQKSSKIVALRGEFIEAADEMGRVLAECETTHAALVERNAMLQRLEDELGEVRVRHRSLQEQNESLRSENDTLRSRIEHFDDLVAKREARINFLESESLKGIARVKELCAEIDELRARISTLTNELEASRAQLDKGDALAENLQGAAVALTAECNVLNYRLAAAQTSLVESQTEAREARDRLTEAEQVNDDLGRRLSESEINQTNTWKRVEMLEQSLSALQLEYDEQRSAYHRYRETQTAETTALRASVDELGSRAAAAEKSLDDMRAETQARMAELRKTERRAEQAETRLAAVEERAEKLQDELAHSVENAARVEISRAHLANRAQALVRAMKDQKARLEAAEQHTRQLEERLSAGGDLAARAESATQATIHELTEAVEKERLARLMAVEALEVARGMTASKPEPAAEAKDEPTTGGIPSAPDVPVELPLATTATPEAPTVAPVEPVVEPQRHMRRKRSARIDRPAKVDPERLVPATAV